MARSISDHGRDLPVTRSTSSLADASRFTSSGMSSSGDPIPTRRLLPSFFRFDRSSPMVSMRNLARSEPILGEPHSLASNCRVSSTHTGITSFAPEYEAAAFSAALSCTRMLPSRNQTMKRLGTRRGGESSCTELAGVCPPTATPASSDSSSAVDGIRERTGEGWDGRRRELDRIALLVHECYKGTGVNRKDTEKVTEKDTEKDTERDTEQPKSASRASELVSILAPRRTPKDGCRFRCIMYILVIRERKTFSSTWVLE